MIELNKLILGDCLENMKNNKEELNTYDKEKVKERASFIHHFANNQVP